MGRGESVVLTTRMANYIVGERFERIPREVVTPIRDSVIDTIGCGILGSTSPLVMLLINYIAEWKSAEEAVIWGTDQKAAIPFAAMVNSAAAHAWDFDDTILPGFMHPGGVAISTGLSIAENKKVSGKEFLTAIVTSYEVANLIGVGLNPKKFASSGFYVSVPVIFVSTTVAGKLLDLNEEQMVAALAIAATQAAGLYSATLVKRLNAPKATMAGIFGAELAKRGLEGPPDPLEADYSGFFKTFSQESQMDLIGPEIGKYSFQVFLKYYPCIRSNHPAVEAVRRIMDEHPELKATEIEKITVYADTNTIEYTVKTTGGGTVVKSVGNALISLPYCVAAMIVDGELTLDQFTELKIQTPEIQELLKKVELVVDPEIDSLPWTQRYRCTVEMKLRNGKTYNKFLAGPKGDPTNPFTEEEMYKKFMRNATRVLEKDRMEELFTILRRIEELDDVGKIARFLSKK